MSRGEAWRAKETCLTSYQVESQSVWIIKQNKTKYFRLRLYDEVS